MKAQAALLLLFCLPAGLLADDWPMWGRDQTRNIVSPEKNPPTDWQVEVKDRDGKIVKAARNIKWSVPLGSHSMGTPVVAGGLVWVGTNNHYPRDPKVIGDASVLLCLRESNGKFLWQYVSKRLETSQNEDAPSASMGSSPVVVGDRLWLITNRSETICFDIGALRRGEGQPRQIWKVDMRKEFGVSPFIPNMTRGFAPSLPAPCKDLIYAVTTNGVDESRKTVPAPEAPSLICIDKNTGKAVWQDNSPGKHIMDCQISSPLVIEVKGKAQVTMGQGDGWLRSFDAETGKLIWKCDLNAKDAKYELAGRGTRNYVVATPVFHDNRIYIPTGQDPEHYEGLGCLHCIDPTKEGDISVDLRENGKIKPNPNSGVVWHTSRKPLPEEEAKKVGRDYDFGRTMSTCAVQDGLVYAVDIGGYLHCFDAKTGRRDWEHDLKASVFAASPLWVDGKVYVSTDEGDVWIFTHGKEKKEPKKFEMGSAYCSTPVFANDVLYVATESTLYAIQEKK